MPTSSSDFGENSTGNNVVAAYSDNVRDKIILTTGANPGGIGGSSAESLAAASPKLLILAGRGQAKLAETIANVKRVNPQVACKPLILDLSSQESCRKAAQEVLEDPDVPHVDILINNAGLMDIPERQLSRDGIEMQFATNHTGHFLFTKLILPKVVTAAKAALPGAPRIVNFSSRAVMFGPVRFSDYNFTKFEKDLPVEEHMWTGARQVYGQFEDKPLLERSGVLSVAVHPGGVMSELARHTDPAKLESIVENVKKSDPKFYMKGLQEGCSTTLVAALDPKVTNKDIFWEDC